jgi:hypothetical protein
VFHPLIKAVGQYKATVFGVDRNAGFSKMLSPLAFRV